MLLNITGRGIITLALFFSHNSKEYIMAKANKLRLLIGQSYTYGGTAFLKGRCKNVDGDTHHYLMSLKVRGKPRFLDTTKEVPEDKVLIRKPDNTSRRENKEVEIPNFRSKLELVKFAEEKHNFKFEGVIKDIKMVDMVSDLTHHIVSNNESSDKEPTLLV